MRLTITFTIPLQRRQIDSLSTWRMNLQHLDPVVIHVLRGLHPLLNFGRAQEFFI